MAKIFISYSSEDEKFAMRLASDLEELGHQPWLDKWNIKVGESIPSKIEHGINEADYVAIILSPHSVKSTWVEREWKAKYWDEIEQSETLVLPILIQDCEIPTLLKTKRYADFRKTYAVGFVELMGSIEPIIKRNIESKEIKPTNYSTDISSLLAEIHSANTSLSKCLARALEIAQGVENISLEQFCRNELKGWDQSDPGKIPGYRHIEAYVSPFGQINMQYIGWGGNPSAVLDYMRRDTKNFFPYKLAIAYPVSKIESKSPKNAPKGILKTTMRLADFITESKNPEAPVFVYARGDSYISILESIRAELTNRLLDLLPRVEIKGEDNSSLS